MGQLLRWVAIGLLVALLCLGGSLWWVTSWLDTPNAGNSNPEAVTVNIARGSTTRAIAEQLAAKGLIDFPKLWGWCARLLDLSASFKAGEYRFDGSENPRELMRLLGEGNVLQYQVSLVEGWTLQQALAKLQAADKLIWDLPGADSQTLFLELKKTLSANRWQTLVADPAFGLPGQAQKTLLPPAEGWLFPDTYSYTADSLASEVVVQAWSKMLQELTRAWQTRTKDLPYKTPAELLTMASIVEKETGRAADRGQIAQVFVRRLGQKMRLQTDPTVIYGLGSEFDGNLTRRHLRTDTPYNSYTRHGLPPTPIALAGLASLQAAAHPATGEYLYFVARGDGTSEFSKTLAQHEAAVRRFQLRR